MPRVVLALLRHGAYDQPPRTPSAHLAFGLNATGREQAMAAVAPLLAKASAESLEIDPILDTSRLLRAWQTAQILPLASRRLGRGRFASPSSTSLPSAASAAPPI